MTNNTPATNHDDIWQAILGIIRTELSEQSFKTWFEFVRCASWDGETLTLAVPDKFYGDWLQDHYKEIILSACMKTISCRPVLAYRVADQTVKEKKQHHISASIPGILSQNKTFSPRPQQGSDPFTLCFNDAYTFDDFVVGPGNRFAHAAAVAISESPSKTYNPFFVYGRSGLGKTHLLQAIAHKIKRSFPEKKVCYTSSESFTNALINSIHKRTTTQFRQQYRSLDVLLIDDIHFIAGKESTQEEFFHTFNTLYDAKKQIILSSDRSPKEIPSLEARLLSRFEWGLITDMQAPDFETRVAILKKKLERESVTVPNEILFYIAEHIKNNIRELEGALIRVCAYATLTEKPVTLSVVEALLQTSVSEEEKKISVDVIQQYVADECGVNVSDLRSKKRTKTIAYPRHIAMFLARKHTHHSLPEIGNFFGGRSHATVMHACSKIQELIDKQLLSNNIIATIENKLFKSL